MRRELLLTDKEEEKSNNLFYFFALKSWVKMIECHTININININAFGNMKQISQPC